MVFLPVLPDARDKKRTIRDIERLLRETYGPASPREPGDPLDVLIRTILSQNTSHINSRRAFENLKQEFREWETVRSAPVKKIEQAIRTGGLAKVKACRIKRILSEIRETYGALSLVSLCDMEPDAAASALARFNGVGPKTINCVLLFGCRMDVFPVDTHILRISKRLGLVPETVNLTRAHQMWADLIPRGLAYSLHLNLIEHGRRTCLARNPKCPHCCLNRTCQYYLSHSSRY
jgi:endonuclease-3